MLVETTPVRSRPLAARLLLATLALFALAPAAGALELDERPGNERWR